jgi:hypothetical protein
MGATYKITISNKTQSREALEQFKAAHTATVQIE